MKIETLVRKGSFALALLVVSAGGLKAAPDLEKAFGRMDTDGNGAISADEFVQAQAEGAKSRGKKEGKSEAQIEKQLANVSKNAPKRFAKADTDGNGELSMDEYVAMREAAAQK